MMQQTVSTVWEYTNQLVRAERRRGGRLYSKIELIGKLDLAITPEDLVNEFVVQILDEDLKEKDFVNLRSEMIWNNNEYFLRRKLSFAFRTFVNNKIKVLKNRKELETKVESDDIMSQHPISGEDKVMNQQVQVMLSKNEAIVLAWRLKEISTEEALKATGYKGKPSLYGVLEDVRAKFYGRPVTSKSNSKIRKADQEK